MTRKNDDLRPAHEHRRTEQAKAAEHVRRAGYAVGGPIQPRIPPRSLADERNRAPDTAQGRRALADAERAAMAGKPRGRPWR
jgi:hypothetical protein